MKCELYIQTPGGARVHDACLICGRTLEAHSASPEPKQEIHIWFGHRLWKFKNWEEARESGFYLG